MNKHTTENYEQLWLAEELRLTTETMNRSWLIAACTIPFFAFFEFKYEQSVFLHALFLLLSISGFLLLITYVKNKIKFPKLVNEYGVSLIIGVSASAIATYTAVDNVHNYVMAISSVILVRGLLYFGNPKSIGIVAIINYGILLVLLSMRAEPIATMPTIGSAFFFSILFVLFAFIGMKNKYILTKQSYINSLMVQASALTIQEKNKQITDSITYAKRIQQAILPNAQAVSGALPNSFILFKPKDIVSGDFYFFEKKDNLVFIAAADCTGHGVPGAIMSMVGYEKLTSAINNSNQVSEILNLLNNGIKAALHQTDSADSTRDGMDIALCAINTTSFTLSYAGAHRPLWIIKNGVAEIIETKATKAAIGGLTSNTQQFEQHDIQLAKGDTLYLFTDGYADQDGGEKGKKLMTKNFKQLLLDIQHKPMPEQQIFLSDFITTWSAQTEQLDDILIIGIQL